MFHILVWKNVVCKRWELHLLKNKGVRVYEILVMLPFVTDLTSYVYSFPEILTADESSLKLSLSNDNSQTGVPNPDCQELERKHETRKKWPRCWSQELAASFSFTNRNVFETTSEANKCAFVRNREQKYYQAVLTVCQLGSFSDRGSLIHHNLQGL